MSSLDPDVLVGLNDAQVSEAADFLGIQSDASIDAVIARLRILSSSGEPAPLGLYRLLARSVEGDPKNAETLVSIFQTERLIWSGTQGWQTSGCLCWSDTSGALPGLSDVWTSTMRTFFRRVGVEDQPTPSVRLQAMLISPRWSTLSDPRMELLTQQLNDDFLRDRLTAEQLEQVRDASCWPAVGPTGAGWFSPDEILIDDDPRRSKSLRADAPLWPGSRRAELIRKLGALNASDAVPYLIDPGLASIEAEVFDDVLARLGHSVAVLVPLIAQLAPAVADAVGRLRMIQPVNGLIGGFELDPYEGGADPLIRAWMINAELLIESQRLSRISHDFGDVLALLVGMPTLRELTKDLWRAADDEAALWDLVDEFVIEHGIQGVLSGRAVPATHGSEVDVDLDDPDANVERATDTPELAGEERVGGSTNSAASTWPGSPNVAAGRALSRPTVGRVVLPAAGSVPSDIARSMSETRGGSAGGGFSSEVDADWNEAVEREAVDWLTGELLNRGAQVISVENQYVGYDLDVIHDGRKIMVEVKGRSSAQPTISLSRNEYECAIRTAETGGEYYVVVVTVFGKAVSSMTIDARAPGFAQAFRPSNYLATAARWMPHSSSSLPIASTDS